jgi:hypothetical protein
MSGESSWSRQSIIHSSLGSGGGCILLEEMVAAEIADSRDLVGCLIS